MIKIIFCDMDGTLLNSKSQLPEGFDKMIELLKSHKIIFAPASGRQYFALKKMFSKYAEEFLFLGDNGTLVMQGGKEIFSSPLENSAVESVLKVAENLDKKILRVWSGKKNAYILDWQDTPNLQAETEKYYTRNVAVKSWAEIDDTPIKISICDPNGHAEETVYPQFKQFSDKLQVVLASSQWVDITAQGINKGAAIKKIQQLLNISPSECAAFGDFMNDFEMLQSVEYSFAMANAYPEIKKIAKFETLSNDDFGVRAGIEKLISLNLI